MRRGLLFTALITLPTALQSPPAPVFSTSGAYFALYVRDLEASRSWYVERLGLRVTLEPPAYNGIRALILEGGGLIVELLQDPKAQAAPPPTMGFFKAGVIVEDYDATLARLRERGVTIALGPFPARNGQRANFLIRDNSGNLIQIFGR